MICAPRNLLRRIGCSPVARGIRAPGRQDSAGGTLDEVNDRLYARRVDAGSAATSVGFALLRGNHQ
jgi:hypothetical protein